MADEPRAVAPGRRAAVKLLRREARPAATTTRPAELGGAPGTVCGYIGGDAALPATCAAGSHCAVNVAARVVGCCPDGRPCDRGFFTACVDRHSRPQTVRDPYVFTCDAGRVCYRNDFDGGLYQYGCGSASHLATHVATAAPGLAPLALRRVTMALADASTPLPTPVVGFRSSSSASARQAAPTPSASEAAAPPPADARSSSTGAIAGSIVGGVAAMVVLVGLCAVLWRRSRRRRRRGPRHGQDTHYVTCVAPSRHDAVSPLTHPCSPMADARHRFEPLPSSQSAGAQVVAMRHHPLGSSNLAAAPGDDDGAAAPPRPDGVDDGARRGRGHVEFDEVPMTTDVYGVSRAMEATPRGAARDPDSATLATVDSASSYPGPRRSGGGALWQQNRRQRRNVWI